ncbi:hypothetical protein TSUD_219330 [Trifolium subterraneum]|uniref:Retrotransposon gag domain-containing protein n=1 Tax=Trifolium subterraneum TaxID=3900 RepID=A0A2Z6NSK4_TRISU|nr:hypothetical protein TSUD_219330 [Trifolium subterraneum]
MAGANHEFVGENNPPNHQNQSDGVETSVTPEGSTAYAQATPLDVPPPHQPPQPEDPLVVPQLPQGAPMEVVMAALVNTINRQGQILREQADNMRGQNELIREQNRRLRAVEDSHATSRISRSVRRQRSPTPENNRSRSRSRSPRPAPRRNVEKPLSPPRDNPRRKNHSPPQRNNHNSPPRNKRSPPQRNNRSPPKNGEAAARGGNVCHSPRRESSGSSIDSWEELCRMFTAHFTTSRRHPKTVASLKAIIQGPEESLRSYIERFNKVSVEVEATDKMKLYLLEEGLREGTKFQEAVGIVEVQTLDAFFELAQRYIKWEDKQKASEVRRPRTFEVGGPSSQREERRGDEKKREGGKVREAKPPKSQFTYHTPLNAPRDRILSEISSAEFKSVGIRFPKQLPAKPNVDKRKFDELEKASQVGEIKITEVKESSVPLAFYREEVPEGSPNFQIPLLVRAKMANFDVRRILVDQGSSCDIMYSGLFKVLQLTEENLVPYVGSDLQGFNGSTTKPWGYVDLIVTFGENKAMKSVKVKFLVVDYPSLYNCIIGRPPLAELFAVCSTIHLKLKYYTKDGQVATINGDIEAARRCFEAASKNLNFVVTPKKKKEETKLSGVNSISTEDGVELDARTSKKERKQEKKTIKDDLLIKENYRPSLMETEMPGIDPEVTCHQLAIDPRASSVVQRRRKQSPEKAEAARKAVKDLLEANFIAEAQYTTWLSNVVLVKKSNGKWHMCVDYTDLNRACPKDAYPLPNIDKLVDNSSGFKLLSFMDAYSVTP